MNGYRKLSILALIICLNFLSGTAIFAKLSDLEITNLQEELRTKGATFTVGRNSATERDIKDLCGLRPPDRWWEGKPFKDIKPRLALPASYNWCNLGGCTPVKNQGSCGSCWAFGTVGALELNIKIKDGMEEDLSEQYLVSCNTDGWGCGGGWWAHDYHEWKYSPPDTEAGAVPESEFPYVANDVPCAGPYSHPWKITDWAYIGDSNSVPAVDSIKQAILDYGPVAVAIYVGPAFNAYTGGIFNINEIGIVNHGVVLVGWDDNQGSDGVWYLRNSWGSGWGESGYMRIEYGKSQVGYGASYVEYPGQVPGFNLSTTTPGPFNMCAPDTQDIQIDVEPNLGFSDPVTLGVSGLPGGVNSSFDINPVTPPESSILTLTITGAAGAGQYDFEVEGNGGGQSDTLPLTLLISTSPPDPPMLMQPADGETHAGYQNISFSWSDLATAASYHLQVDDDSSFLSPEADVSSISSNSYILSGPLTEGQTYYWRVSAANSCGEGPFSEAFSFVAEPRTILLVDDDDNDPDVRPHYEDALTALGYTYNVWDTGNADNEPTLADLSPYQMVIWFTGHQWFDYTGPGADAEDALAAYLDSGGKLFISSQDYHFDRGRTAFMQNQLGVGSIINDSGNYTSVSGHNDFAGLGPYNLNYPFYDYSDIVYPGSGAAVSFIGNNANNAGVYTNNTVFFVFPWEAVASNGTSQQLRSSDGNEMLAVIISYLLPVEPCGCDLNGDGSCNGPDWLLFYPDWGRTDCNDPGVDCECDLNGDGSCNGLDWLLFYPDWGRTDCP